MFDPFFSARWVVALVVLMAGVVRGAEVGAGGTDGPSERAYEVGVMCRIVEPVLVAGSEGRLRDKILHGEKKPDASAPLEALGRTIAGVSPWLELGPGEDAEGKLRARYIRLAVGAIRNAVDPGSPDVMNFSRGGGQPLVDTAFLAQGLMRAPKQLWGNLDEVTRGRVVEALKSSRVIKPGVNNWELFSAMVEAALLKYTGECEMGPIEKAVNDHMAWYKGDGTYGDGPEFHWDYYNSFVIQPMLWEVLEECESAKRPMGKTFAVVRKRAQRYAEVEEQMISPEGSFPVIGRSATYRFGAFQELSMMALRHELPAKLSPGGVRAALNAVIHRMAEAPGTFDGEGWLRVGVVGAQGKMGQAYINGGSVYLCTEGLLQLGLPAGDAFWTDADGSWTQKRIWAGEDVEADHAMKE